MKSSGPLRAALALAATLAVLHGIGAWDVLAAPRRVELAAYDVHVVWSTWLQPPAPPDERLLLLAYDEAARQAQRERNIPTAEHLLAATVDAVADRGARLVFVDVPLDTPHLADLGRRFDEAISGIPPVLIGPDVRARLQGISEELQPELGLEAAMAKVPTMLLYACAPGVPGADAGEADAAFLEKAGAVQADALPFHVRRVGRLRSPQPRLLAAARHLVHSCEFPDEDGVLRTDPALLSVTADGETMLLPSAATALARELLELPPDELVAVPEGLRIGERRLEFDPQGEALIGYSGPAGSFRGRQGKPARHSIAELLRDEIPRARIEGKVILVGDTRQLTRDAKLTPFGYGLAGRTPGVEKIAMQTDYLVKGDYRSRPAWAARWGFALTLLAGVAAAALGARVGFYVALGMLPFAAVVFLSGTAALCFGRVWIDTGFPALSWFGCLLTASLVRYAQEVGQRRFLESAFELYVPPEMVRTLVRDPSALKLAGDEREMTVLFADLRGFTTFSEGHSPADVVGHLNEHLTAMSDIIQAHGGTVDKFIGDAVMAFWGAPMPDPDHAVHACQAACEMLAVLDRRNEVHIVKGEAMVDMGIGLNTGPMIVGNMGSARRFNYTVIGDAVNLASRLEGLTKEYHERILVGPRTRDLASASYAFRPLGEVTVKGKQERVPVFSLEEGVSPPAASAKRPAGTGTAKKAG